MNIVYTFSECQNIFLVYIFKVISISLFICYKSGMNEYVKKGKVCKVQEFEIEERYRVNSILRIWPCTCTVAEIFYSEMRKDPVNTSSKHILVHRSCIKSLDVLNEVSSVNLLTTAYNFGYRVVKDLILDPALARQQALMQDWFVYMCGIRFHEEGFIIPVFHWKRSLKVWE